MYRLDDIALAYVLVFGVRRTRLCDQPTHRARALAMAVPDASEMRLPALGARSKLASHMELQ